MTAALYWYRQDLWPRGKNREPRESFCTTNIMMQWTDCLLRTGGEKSQFSPSVRISGSQLASAHAATSESSYPAKGSMWKQRGTPRHKDKSFDDNKASSKQVLLNKCCGPLVLLVPQPVTCRGARCTAKAPANCKDSCCLWTWQVLWPGQQRWSNSTSRFVMRFYRRHPKNDNQVITS